MADPTPDLVAWLRGVLAEDEDELRTRWRLDEAEWALPECGTRDALLADIAAKRAILDEHTATVVAACPTCAVDIGGNHVASIRSPCRTVRLLASAYRDRPGYRPEWAP